MNNKKPGLFYGYIITAIAFIIIGINFGTVQSFGVFLEPMLEQLGWTRSSISGAFSLALIVGGIIGIVSGRITDRFGPRLFITISAVFTGAGYLLMPLVHSPWQMYLFYGLLTGIGVGALPPALYATISRWFTKRRGMMTGIMTAGIGTGTIAISQLARWLITIRDWQFAFLIIGIVGLVVTGVAAQFLKRDPQSIGQLSDGDKQPTVNPRINIKLPTGGLTVTKVLRTKEFWLYCLAYLFIGVINLTIPAHIVIHATGLNISYTFAVSLLTIMSIPNIIGQLVAGSVADRIGNRRTIIIGSCILCLAFVWLLFAKEAWMLVIFVIAFGFGIGTCVVPMIPLVSELFGMESLGVVLGVVNISSCVGSALGPIMAGFIYDAQKSYQLDFMLLAVFAVVITVTMLFLKTKRPASKIGL